MTVRYELPAKGENLYCEIFGSGICDVSAVPSTIHGDLLWRLLCDDKSYSEDDTAIGVSKQAAHKLAGVAIATLR